MNKVRKNISFKIENLPLKQQEIINAWADGQANIQQSLANLVMHVVNFTGNDDVMDFEVQGKLHTIFKGQAQVMVNTTTTDSAPVIRKVIEQEKNTDQVEPKQNIYKNAADVFED